MEQHQLHPQNKGNKEQHLRHPGELCLQHFPKLAMVGKFKVSKPWTLSQGVQSSVQPGLGTSRDGAACARPPHPDREGFLGAPYPKAPLYQCEAIPLVLSLPAHGNIPRGTMTTHRAQQEAESCKTTGFPFLPLFF